jgi:hypothetical protein
VNDGFAIDLDEAEKAAKYPDGSLAHAAEYLRAPLVGLIMSCHDFAKPGGSQAADRLQGAYPVWSHMIAQRMEHACEILDANAEALRQILGLYRRVDGRS